MWFLVWFSSKSDAVFGSFITSHVFWKHTLGSLPLTRMILFGWTSIFHLLSCTPPVHWRLSYILPRIIYWCFFHVSICGTTLYYMVRFVWASTARGSSTVLLFGFKVMNNGKKMIDLISIVRFLVWREHRPKYRPLLRTINLPIYCFGGYAATIQKPHIPDI